MDTAMPVALQDSWTRCHRAGLDPRWVGPGRILEADELADRRRCSPLASAVPMLSHALGTDDDAARLMVITDPDGTVLWRSGSHPALRRADSIGFYEGAGWKDSEVGTNAIGQSLVTGAPSVVRGEQHFAHSHTGWDCLSVPVRDPRAGTVAGVIDLSAPAGTTTPDTARLVQLAADLVARMNPDSAFAGGRAPVGSEGIEIRLLTESPAIRVGGTWRPLGSRAAELLALFDKRPGGWSAEELALELYGFDGNAVTVRAEIHRLRRLTGVGIVAGPYRWADPESVVTDLERLRRAVVNGEAEQSLKLRGAGLLPRSTAPAVTAWRAEIDRMVADVVAEHGDEFHRRECDWAQIGTWE